MSSKYCNVCMGRGFYIDRFRYNNTPCFACLGTGMVADAPPETEAEIDAYLLKHGYDPEQLAKQARDIFGEAIESSPLNPENQDKDKKA